jgi:adenosylhomocysteine nucleosidase
VSKVAIIAALEREIASLIDDQLWRTVKLIPSPHRDYESNYGFIVCSGMGGMAARQAAEQVLGRVRPSFLISAGIAGALTPGWKVGDVIAPAVVVQVGGTPRKTASLPEIPGLQRRGTLVSAPSIAGPEEKANLARQYQADAIDMEAGFVAEVAAAHDVPFAAVKAISDAHDFPLPDLGRFMAPDGRFRTSRFVAYSMLRPTTWPAVCHLARNSNKASRELCRVLRLLLTTGALGAAPSSGVRSSGAVNI